MHVIIVFVIKIGNSSAEKILYRVITNHYILKPAQKTFIEYLFFYLSEKGLSKQNDASTAR